MILENQGQWRELEMKEFSKRQVRFKKVMCWSWEKEVNLKCYHHRLVIEYEEAPKENLKRKMEKEKQSHERKHPMRQIFYQLRDHKSNFFFYCMDTQRRDIIWLQHQILWGDDGVWMQTTSTQRLVNDHRQVVCEKNISKRVFP